LIGKYCEHVNGDEFTVSGCVEVDVVELMQLLISNPKLAHVFGFIVHVFIPSLFVYIESTVKNDCTKLFHVFMITESHVFSNFFGNSIEEF
jgi:hypothetical protein